MLRVMLAITLIATRLPPADEAPTVSSPTVDPPRSRAEQSGFEETSRYADVMAFLSAMQRRNALLRVEIFGSSERGRPLPLAILHDPPISSPAEARRSGQPIFFVMGNIHAGEVDGKEACLHLIRDLLEESSPLLEKLVILVAPIYNADGNEQIDPSHRRNQYGPFGGVGQRANAHGLDLNRDFTKLQASETRALVGRIFGAWDPHVVVDCHTTDGSFHGFALTYATGQHPDSDPALIALAHDRILPHATRLVAERTPYEISFYGNYVDRRDPAKGWATYDWRARYGINCVGLRNRIGILSESYAYLSFEKRCDVTYHFVRALLDAVAERSNAVLEVTRAADERSRQIWRREPRAALGLDFEIAALDEAITVPVREATMDRDAGPSQPIVVFRETVTRTEMPYFGRFRSTRSREMPAGYLIQSGHQEAVRTLVRHGLVVERLEERAIVEDADSYQVLTITRARRAYQGVRATRLTTKLRPGTLVIEPGRWLVRMDQPLARLAFHLLEPESDDGLFAWGFFAEALRSMTPGSDEALAPVVRLRQIPPVATRIVHRCDDVSEYR